MDWESWERGPGRPQDQWGGREGEEEGVSIHRSGIQYLHSFTPDNIPGMTSQGPE